MSNNIHAYIHIHTTYIHANNGGSTLKNKKNADEIPKIICFWPFLGENMQIRVLRGGGNFRETFDIMLS